MTDIYLTLSLFKEAHSYLEKLDSRRKDSSSSFSPPFLFSSFFFVRKEMLKCCVLDFRFVTLFGRHALLSSGVKARSRSGSDKRGGGGDEHEAKITETKGGGGK